MSKHFRDAPQEHLSKEYAFSKKKAEATEKVGIHFPQLNFAFKPG